jgi:hypothetical protein
MISVRVPLRRTDSICLPGKDAERGINRERRASVPFDARAI